MERESRVRRGSVDWLKHERQLEKHQDRAVLIRNRDIISEPK